MTIEILEFDVSGLPKGYKRPTPGAQKGKPRGRVIRNRGADQWKTEVRWAALQSLGLEEAPDVPVFASGVPLELIVTFRLPRPDSHYQDGCGALLKRAPAYPTARGTGDLSNLVKEIEDALCRFPRRARPIAYRDDAQIVATDSQKIWASFDHPEGDDAPGASVILRALAGERWS